MDNGAYRLTGTTVWQRQSRFVQGTVILVGTGVALFAMYKTYQYFQEQANTKAQREELQTIDSELRALAAKGIHPSFTEGQFLEQANTMKKAFDGCGTDQGSVYKVLKSLKNQADWLSLKKAFGIRKIQGCGFGEDPLELSQALTIELDVNQIALIGAYLATNRIKTAFN